MTKREAKQWVCDRVSVCLDAGTAFFDDVLFADLHGEPFDTADEERIREAADTLAEELARRGAKCLER